MALELQALHCKLGSRPVLKGLSARALHEGSIVAVVGRNGAGKSTLLRAIAGIVPCAADRLHLGGHDLRPLSAARRADAIRYLPQSAPGSLHLTVYESMLVALHAHRTQHGTAGRGRIAETATELGLTPLLDQYLDELSGGQRQLVWLAQALMHRPQVLLLDEPLAALDPNYQHHVMQRLRHLAAAHNLLAVVVLHDLNMAMRYADQVIVLQDGAVIAQGTASEALNSATLARAFLVDARIEHCTQGTPLVIVDDLLHL